MDYRGKVLQRPRPAEVAPILKQKTYSPPPHLTPLRQGHKTQKTPSAQHKTYVRPGDARGRIRLEKKSSRGRGQGHSMITPAFGTKKENIHTNMGATHNFLSEGVAYNTRSPSLIPIGERQTRSGTRHPFGRRGYGGRCLSSPRPGAAW